MLQAQLPRPLPRPLLKSLLLFCASQDTPYFVAAACSIFTPSHISTFFANVHPSILSSIIEQAFLIDSLSPLLAALAAKHFPPSVPEPITITVDRPSPVVLGQLYIVEFLLDDGIEFTCELLEDGLHLSGRDVIPNSIISLFHCVPDKHIYAFTQIVEPPLEGSIYPFFLTTIPFSYPA